MFSFLFLAAAACTMAEGQEERPNVVVILADDLGFTDLGSFGGEIQTPHLDALASEGLRYSKFYNTGRCWPSRASILSGYYAQQVAMDPVYGKEWPQWTRLLPHYLKPAGYRSYLSGKWHLRYNPSDPEHGGFDRSYQVADHDRFFSPKGHFLDGRKLPQPDPNSGYYSTIEITDRAISFLGEHEKEAGGSPFFLYLGYTAPHFPLHALPEDIERYEGRYDAGWDVLREERYLKAKELGLVQGEMARRQPEVRPRWSVSEERLKAELHPGEVGYAVDWSELTAEEKAFQADKMEVHAAMVDRMDREIGRLLDYLKEMGAFENTLIFFMSDNGATAEQMIRGDGPNLGAKPGTAESYLALGPGWSTAANSPLSLHKSWNHEGGIATPLIVHWPSEIAPVEGFCREPGHLVDLLPTILDAAGIDADMSWNDMDAPPFPGRSLVPSFDGGVDWLPRPLFFSHFENKALRWGDWKAVMRRDHLDTWELYRIDNDRGETENLAEQYPQILRQLVEEWEAMALQFKIDGERGRDPDAKVTRLHVDF